MKVAIIGSGNVGSAVAEAAKQAGHEITVASPQPERREGLGDKLGVGTTSSNVDAVEGADLVVLAVPFGSFNDVVRDIAGKVGGKIVVDATNPIREDYSGLATEGSSGAELLQQQLPDARVVKAFNSVFASNQAGPVVDGVQLDGFVAGDDAEAKKQVLDLLRDIGYRPIDAGPLSAARYLEGMAFLNISLNAANGWPWQTGWKLVGPGPANSPE